MLRLSQIVSKITEVIIIVILFKDILSFSCYLVPRWGRLIHFLSLLKRFLWLSTLFFLRDCYFPNVLL